MQDEKIGYGQSDNVLIQWLVGSGVDGWLTLTVLCQAHRPQQEGKRRRSRLGLVLKR